MGRVVRVAGTLWACQYVSYALWDQSVVYGTADFSRT